MTHTHPRPAPEPQITRGAAQLPCAPTSFHTEYLALLERVRPVRERAERLRWSLFRRAAALCRRAGLEPDLAGTQMHNFLIDAHRDRAWTNVSLPLAEESARLYARQFDGYRVYERYFHKLERELHRRWFGDPSVR